MWQFFGGLTNNGHHDMPAFESCLHSHVGHRLIHVLFHGLKIALRWRLCKRRKKAWKKPELGHIVWKSTKMSHLNYGILAFSTNFCPIISNLSGNTVWPQAFWMRLFFNFQTLCLTRGLSDNHAFIHHEKISYFPYFQEIDHLQKFFWASKNLSFFSAWEWMENTFYDVIRVFFF